MGRPEKRTAEYFPFKVKDGRTLAVLQHTFGLAGIGFFTNLMRILTETPGHYLHLSDASDQLYLSSKIGCDVSDTETYLETMITTRKLHRNLWETYKIIYCPDLVDSLLPLYDKRKTAPITIAEIILLISDAESTSIAFVSDAETVVPDVETTQSKEEERKVEQSKDVARKDEVFIAYKDGIEALGLPTLSWPNTHKQHAALKDITAKTHALAPDSAIPDPVEFARGILAVFKRKRDTGKSDYWKGASPEPVVLQRRFGELVTGLAAEYDRAAAWEEA